MNKLIKTLDKKQVAVLLVLWSYMFQGVATLIYQVSWEQSMENIIGMALPTMSIIVSVFFFGMALGAYIFAKVSINSRWAGKLFVINQICLSLFGLIFIATDGLKFLWHLTTEWQNWLLLVYLLRLLGIALFLLVPAFFVGAAFSLLLKCNILFAWSGKAEKLYLANLSGSIIGAVLAGFMLLPNFGLMTSTFFAALLNFAAVPFFLLGERIGSLSNGSERLESVVEDAQLERIALEDSEAGKSKGLFLLAIGASAFFNMLLELLFMRLFVLCMGSSAFAFSLVSAVQLFALGCGSFAVNFIYKQKKGNIWHVFTFLYLIAAVWLLIELMFFPDLIGIIATAKSILINNFYLTPSLSFFLSHSIVLLFLMVVPCFCLGANLPLYFQLRNLYPTLAPMKSSYAYAANLFASVLGCFGAGILLFPVLSNISNHAIYFAFIFSALAILWLGLAIYIFGILRYKTNKVVYLGAAVLVIVALNICYWPLAKRSLLPNETELLFYKEGVNSTVSLSADMDKNVICLKTNGQTETTLPLNEKLPALLSDESTQILLGVLPNLFSLRKIKEVFLLGLGSGVTAQAILSNPEVENLRVAELEPAMVSVSQQLRCGGPDKRLNIKIIDGRSMLSMLDHSYDVIVSQPGEPWRSSSKYLYTLEFWQLAKSRLKADGIFCQWLPLYVIDESSLLTLCHTFASVFPDTFVIRVKNAGELILLAFNSESNKNTTEQTIIVGMIEKAIKCSKLPEIRHNLVKMGFDNLSDLLHIFRLGPESFDNWALESKDGASKVMRLNCDNFPFVQYKLQSISMHQGININIDINKVLPEVLMPPIFLRSTQLISEKDNRLSNISENLARAEQLIIQNNFGEAIFCLNEVLRQQANNFEARFILGRILCYSNKEQEGLLQIKWANKINPESAEPNLYVTLFYAFKNNWQMAKNNLLLLEKKLYGDPGVSYLANKIYSKQKLDKSDNKIKMLMFKCHYPI